MNRNVVLRTSNSDTFDKPAKPHLSKGRLLGAAIGNGGDAKLPRGLRIEW